REAGVGAPRAGAPGVGGLDLGDLELLVGDGAGALAGALGGVLRGAPARALPGALAGGLRGRPAGALLGSGRRLGGVPSVVVGCRCHLADGVGLAGEADAGLGQLAQDGAALGRADSGGLEGPPHLVEREAPLGAATLEEVVERGTRRLRERGLDGASRHGTPPSLRCVSAARIVVVRWWRTHLTERRAAGFLFPERGSGGLRGFVEERSGRTVMPSRTVFTR